MNDTPPFIVYGIGTLVWIVAAFFACGIAACVYQWIVDRAYDYRKWRNKK